MPVKKHWENYIFCLIITYFDNIYDTTCKDATYYKKTVS